MSDGRSSATECPSCGEVVAADSTICPHCGADLDAAGGGPASGAPGDSSGGEDGDPFGDEGSGRPAGGAGGGAGAAGGSAATDAYCPTCGEPVSATATTCPHCGASVQADVETSGTVGEGAAPPDRAHDSSPFEFSLKYPVSNDWGPIVVGGLLTLLTFVLFLTLVLWIVPALLLTGYSVRVGRAAARGDRSIPDYGDWGQLLVNGVLYLVAFLPFGVASAVVLGGLVLVGTQTDPGVAAALGGLAVLLALPLAYVGGAIIPTLLATGSVRETYAGGRFLKTALTKEYLVAVLVLFVVQFLAQTVLSIAIGILFVTVIGWLLLPFVYLGASAYMSYLSMAVWGYATWDAEGHAVLGPLDAAESLDIEF